jgi:bifunctional non-homologous end joining protein LigD
MPTTVSGRSVILDGEIVALHADDVPCFTRLQRRWPENRRPSAELPREVPVRFFAFDILSLVVRDISREPYSARRSLLSEFASGSAGSVVQFPANWTDIDPAVVLVASADLGLEGHRL